MRFLALLHPLARETLLVYSVTVARSLLPLLQYVQGLESCIRTIAIELTKISLPGHIASLLWLGKMTHS